MTPATTTLKIFRGAKRDHEIHFFQTGTTTAIDLTGLAPFTMEIRRKQGSPLLLAPTYTAVDLANGKIRFTATATQTLTLPEPPSPQNPIFYQSDGIHLTDAGNARYARIVVKALR